MKDGEAVHSIVAFAPWLLSAGGVISATVIVWLTGKLIFPQISVARQVLFIE